MINEYIYDEKDGFSSYKAEKKTAICLGFFDGLHLGHLHIVKEALKESDNVSLLTFEGPLKQMTNKRDSSSFLTSVEDRKEILSKIGVNNLFVIHFDDFIKNMEPMDFINKVLKPLNISSIYIGSDFRFGKKGAGDVSLLKEYFTVHVVDFIYASKDEKISTTLIVKLIKEGKIEEADKYLGRLYSIKGKVVHGLGNGHKLGFPTSNIKPLSNYVIPKRGVYLTYLQYEDKKYLSMTDIGVHPTLDMLEEESIETNIISKDPIDLYGKEVTLCFVSFIREEKKFSSIDELIDQLTKDQEAIIEKSNKN